MIIILNLIKKIFTIIGIDKAILYTLLARGVQGLGNILIILVIAKYLNITEQGYYYTFGSILALQMFFELGLSSIISQFAAHEMAKLKWINKIDLDGEIKNLSRLSSLLHFCIKWFSVVSIFLFVFLLIVGYTFFLYFSDFGVDVNWEMPWLILALSSACNLLVTPLLSFFEGIGKIKDVAKLRMYQQLILLSSLFLLLIFGFKLFSGGLASLISFFVVAIWIISKKQLIILKLLWSKKIDYFIISWKKEMFPYQWRTAISWISGFFMFFLFNPILFASEGAKIAGQMGMTLAVLKGITSVVMSWINTKIPLLSVYISRMDYVNLDKLFNRTSLQAMSISTFILFIFIIVMVLLINQENPVVDRFLSMTNIILLCIITFINQIIFFLATYLRCHKKEPFMVNSIVMALLITSSTLIFGNLFGINGVVWGYFFLTLFIYFPWVIYLFKQKRKLWHK